MARKNRQQRAQAARDRFERLVPQIFDQNIVQQCVDALLEVQNNGGTAGDDDWQRVFPHLQQLDQRLMAVLAYSLQSGINDAPADPKPVKRDIPPITTEPETPADSA